MRSEVQKQQERYDLWLTVMILAVIAGGCALDIAEWLPLIILGPITLYLHGTG
jgi:hypothetical protein